MKSAYTPDGAYLGDSVWAYRLCKVRGIKPELRTPHSNVCSIGFCEREQKWYGWSHRAMWGFGVGDSVKKGDCAYVPAIPQELYDELLEYNKPENLEILSAGVRIRVPMSKVGIRDLETNTTEWIETEPGYHIVETGRGEWTAATLDDCRQMACDFAEGVS
jgi:hypothetical protein